MNSAAFLRLLFDDNSPGHFVLWARKDKRARWLPANNPEEAGRRAEQLAAVDDVYFGVALQDKGAAVAKWRNDNPHVIGEPTTRGYSETTVVLPGLWADVDVQGPAHKAVNLPPSKAAAQALIEEFPLLPTLVTDSGHGLQTWWLFREPWVFDTPADRQKGQPLARRFIATLQATAQAHGWQIDPTSDLARVMRLPGTWNRKLEPVPVQVIEYNETCRYNPSDFEEYLIDAPRPEHLLKQWHGPSGAVAPILTHCEFIKYCQTHAAELPEPFWYPMISNLGRLEGGRQAIHTLSQPYPGYSPAETDKKIDHALHAAGPRTCQYIQQSLGFVGCPPHGCGVKAPAGLGVSRRAVQLAEARERYTATVEQARQRRAAAIALAQRIRAKRDGVVGEVRTHEYN
jgi:hypothetical protein